MANAIVLCAGLGTRLGRLTEETPKPLLPVGDRPLLAHTLDFLGRQGFHDVAVNTHHLAPAFESLRPAGSALTLLHEPELRGTAGAIGSAKAKLVAPLLVWNGDIVCEPRLSELTERVALGGICLLVLPVAPGQSSNVGLDSTGNVVRLRQETFGHEQQAANYAGILALGADVFETVPEWGCLIGDVCLPRLRSGGSITTASHAGPWSEVGSVVGYHRQNLAWLEQRGLHEYRAPGARIAAGVELVDSLVHAGASVAGSGALQRSIVFPGASAVAPLADAIVLPGGVVRVGG